MLKTKQQAQDGVTYAKAHITKKRLNDSFSLSQKQSLKSVNQELPVNSSEAICLLGPCRSPKDNGLVTANSLFAGMTYLSLSLLPVKVCHFCTVPWSSFLFAG